MRAFLAEGANVSYCSRKASGDEVADMATDDQNTSRPVVIASQVDVSDHAGLARWVEDAASRFGRIDHIVANGKLAPCFRMIYVPLARLTKVEHTKIASPIIHSPDIESWRACFEADVLGLIVLIQAATPHLQRSSAVSLENHDSINNRSTASDEASRMPSTSHTDTPTADVITTTASITIISSMVGWERLDPVIGSPYTTLKRAQATMARDYVRQLSPLGIRINVVVPGMISVDSIPILEHMLPEYLTLIPLGRVGLPKDVANACVFLGSEVSSFVTGAVLFVDGGLSTSL